MPASPSPPCIWTSSVKIPGGDQTKFDQAAQNAKKGCPVSRVLNANITMEAKLVS